MLSVTCFSCLFSFFSGPMFFLPSSCPVIFWRWLLSCIWISVFLRLRLCWNCFFFRFRPVFFKILLVLRLPFVYLRSLRGCGLCCVLVVSTRGTTGSSIQFSCCPVPFFTRLGLSDTMLRVPLPRWNLLGQIVVFHPVFVTSSRFSCGKISILCSRCVNCRNRFNQSRCEYRISVRSLCFQVWYYIFLSH